MPRKGTYNINTVLKIIQRKQNEKRTKSVTSPPAQTFDLCNGQESLQRLHFLVSSALEDWKISYPILYKFAVMQISTGARVSELLRIHSKEISPEGRILIRALKGGNDRVEKIPELTPWLIKERSKSRYIFQDLTRFVIHHRYLEKGISAYFGKNSKRSTTHLFRHLVGLDMNQLKDSTHGIKTALGQKTDKAANYYKTQARRENDQ